MRVNGVGRAITNTIAVRLTGQCHPCPRLPGYNNQPPSEDKEEEKSKSHTFILSESLVLVDYGRVLALGSHLNRTEWEDKVRHRFGANFEPKEFRD
jgi:hypothetical protein